MQELFIKASRLKLRFDTKQGPLSVEDLWDLPLISKQRNGADLDDLATTLNKAISDAGTTSFVKKATRPNEILKLKFNIVLHVIEVKQAEEEAAEARAENAAKKQRILEILEQKKDEELLGKSEDELRALLSEI